MNIYEYRFKNGHSDCGDTLDERIFLAYVNISSAWNGDEI